MKHAEKLIARILFLEWTPVIGSLNKIHIGKNIQEQFKNDCASETDAIKVYNKSIYLAKK